MRRPRERFSPLDKGDAARRIARIISRNNMYIGNIPQELLEPFEIGEVVIHGGRAGGGPLIVKGSPGYKYLGYRDEGNRY